MIAVAVAVAAVAVAAVAVAVCCGSSIANCTADDCKWWIVLVLLIVQMAISNSDNDCS